MKILTKNPENRLSIPEIKKHPWMTRNGQDPMAELEVQRIELTEQDKMNAFSTVKLFGDVIMKKIVTMQRNSMNAEAGKAKGILQKIMGG